MFSSQPQPPDPLVVRRRRFEALVRGGMPTPKAWAQADREMRAARPARFPEYRDVPSLSLAINRDWRGRMAVLRAIMRDRR